MGRNNSSMAEVWFCGGTVVNRGAPRFGTVVGKCGGEPLLKGSPTTVPAVPIGGQVQAGSVVR